jgi:AcrR family transcriptional regulator
MAAAKRMRLHPEQRRKQILQCARMLFVERGYEPVSTADVARAAGVTTALVHHYFGGKRGLYLAVARWIVETARDVSSTVVDSDDPVDVRVAATIDAWLDYLEREGSAWMSVTGYGELVDPEIADLATAARETCAARMLRSYADLVPDTPATRFAVRSFIALNEAVSRELLDRKITRTQAHALLTSMLVNILLHAAPALDAASMDSADTRFESSSAGLS